MRLLTKEDISKNNVDTISQYKILEYLKYYLNIDEFDIYLVDYNNIKVIDKTDDYLFFSYDNVKKEVIYQNECTESEHEFEI